MANADLQENIKSGILSSGDSRVFIPTNRPDQYSSRQKEYFAKRTASFREKKLKYATDYFVGQVQGLVLEDPTKWITTRFRMAEVVRPSSAIQRDFDDYKMVMMEDPTIDYIPQGAKFDAMGSIWLMWNPANVSAPGATGIVRRCRATWNHLDYYGNLLQEPLIVENTVAQDSSGKYREFTNETQGYFTITCQKNGYTTQLDNNSRLILGAGAYRITGFTDFLEEFTGDFDSVRLIRFVVRYEEPNDRIDDMVNHVAGGKEFNWEITLSGTPSLYVGNTGKIVPTSQRNGVIVTDSAENPITYAWESSDETVCTVDEDGNLVAVGAGTAVISATLEQNPAHSAQMTVSVEDAENTKAVLFKGTMPDKLRYYETATISAAYYEDGQETDKPVKFYFSGADTGTYSAEVNDNTVTVTCYGGSVEPLTIYAQHGNCEATTSVKLIGI